MEKLDSLPALKNDLLLRAALGESVERLPVWIMRQAGRYLPEYMSYTRDKTFLQVCQTPEYACEVTLQPVRRFCGLLDAAIIFSDILVVPQALDIVVTMEPQRGPVMSPVRTVQEYEDLILLSFLNHVASSDYYASLSNIETDLCEHILENTKIELIKLRFLLSSLHNAVVQNAPIGSNKDKIDRNSTENDALLLSLALAFVKTTMPYVAEAITRTRIALNGEVPLLGFAGAPWTLLSYLAEGSGSRLYIHAKHWIYAQTHEAESFLTLLTYIVAAHLIVQIEAGAQAIQVFDSHAGELPPHVYARHSAAHLLTIAHLVRSYFKTKFSGDTHVPPLILFCKGIEIQRFPYLHQPRVSYDVVSVDFSHDLASSIRMRSELNDASVDAEGYCLPAFQGNMDPGFLSASPEVIRSEVKRIYDAVSEARIRTAVKGERAIRTISESGIPMGIIANLGHGITPNAPVDAVETFLRAIHDYRYSISK